MSEIDDIEAKLHKIKELRAIEYAFDLLARGPVNGARISKIVAQDDAESERSVVLDFTAEESAAIFAAAEAVLQSRYQALKAAVGA